MTWTRLAAGGALLAMMIAATAAQDRPALSPVESLATFVLEPGYRIDLAAAEPLVQSPVAMAFDERGRMYVAENRGYPDPLEGEPSSAPQGVIALLTDNDGDGRYDTRRDFATGLTYPNGVLPWDGGVFVSVAPDFLYLKDTNGDGVADQRRVVLTGFNANRTAQIRFSHPTLGPDGWIYLTSGLNGGRVRSTAHPERPPVEFTTSDSRFNPRTGEFEMAGGQGQFGLTFDDYGRRFICANRNPVWHVVLERQQLQRNPGLAFSEMVQDVSTFGAQAAVWPLSRDLTTASFHPSLMSAPHAGTFTAASGVHIHRGDALPAGHRGSVFIAESAQNLVQRQVLEPDGVTFRSRPARTGVEFLASPDSWFRPVFLTNGPDGALYVVDMYRKDIDHPAYVPEPSRRLFDFAAGRNHGRIYRIAAADRPPARATADLGDASVATLVANLDDANAWRRETAQRRLIERGEREARPLLRAMANGPSEAGRLHALWTMDALGVLEEADVARALQDPAAAVRENAARLVERRGSSRLFEALRPLADDPDARVRLHVALALGAVNDAQRIPLLASIARRDGADRWIRAAVLSSVRDSTGAFFDAFAAAPPQSTGAHAAVMQDLGRLFGATESAERCLSWVTAVADPATELSWQPAALSGLGVGLRSRGSGPDMESGLMALVSPDTPRAREARDRLATIMRRAGELAMRERAPPTERLSAIELLGNGDWTTSGTTLLRLLQPQQPNDIQVAAVRALAAMRDPSAAERLVERSRWQAFTPRVRDAVLTALLADDRLAPTLLDAVARRDVSASAVSPSRWQRLRNHRIPAIRQRAEALAVSGTGDAMRAYERKLREVAGLAGDPARGAAVFTQFCSLCHTSGGRGGHVGPDLSGIRNQPLDALLLHIVVPDYEITPRYEAYTLETRDGRTIFGRLESEAPNSVTLRDASGQAHTVVRTDVKAMTAGTSSLMPAGLDQAMSAQALADLLAHLKHPQQP